PPATGFPDAVRFGRERRGARVDVDHDGQGLAANEGPVFPSSLPGTPAPAWIRADPTSASYRVQLRV
ncbi:hypothetical protein, partial [Glycomyces tenuis]|uniref:hypothetical protein n=1 Tax=Glycomyces tenuis TaxID=58116 RepID=UPI0005547189